MSPPLLRMRECVLAVLLGLSAAELSGSFELRPGVIVDRARDAVYVGGPTGGVQAIELSFGIGRPAETEDRWTVVSMDSGDRVGDLRQDRSAATFFAANGSLGFVFQPQGFHRGADWVEVPPEVITVSRSTGDAILRRAVRNLESRGPMPPS